MKYKELNLRELREEADLDFAHFTFEPNQCSCCYGPKDLPARYWRNGIIPKDNDNFTYILFKNANNGSGSVTKEDEIQNYTCVMHRFRDDDQRDKTCRLLAEQLTDDYVVAVPCNSGYTIIIFKKAQFKEEKKKINNRFHYVHVEDIQGHASLYRMEINMKDRP